MHKRSMEMHFVYKETLTCLSRAAEFKDNETARYTERIGTYSHRLAMIAGLGTDLHSNTMKMASLIGLTHHERWDGTGYPFGIQGENRLQDNNCEELS